MNITDKNRAKLRREVQEGDVVRFWGLGKDSDLVLEGTITWPGMRGPQDFCSVQSRLASYPHSVDYYRVVSWSRNR